MDWNAIKTEYITNESSSYRKLAKKYGVSSTTIAVKASKEGWVKDREQYLSETLSKSLKSISNGQAKRAKRLQNVADKLLSKIEAAVDSFDMKELMLDKQALKQITGALKDIKDIQMIKSDADMREQEARIKNLQKQSEAEDKDNNEIRVTIECGLDEYSK